MTTTQITNKGLRTRNQILETAMQLFREKGYDGTTMRDIAARMDIAVGNAYHYFRSKDELVVAFYERLNNEQAERVYAALLQHQSLKDRLIAAIRCKLGVVADHRDLCISLFAIAVKPNSVVNPFGDSTKGARAKSQSIFRRAVEGSTTRVPDDLKDVLPVLLWLYYMAVLLYWMHDTSPLQHKTNELIELSAQIIALLISVSSLPPLAPIRRSLIELILRLQSQS
jgi:AcrR family transcriptional regulator